MIKTLFITIVLTISALFSYSQEKNTSIPRHNYIGLGAGISKVAVRDQLNTSLPYTGIGMGSNFDVTLSFKRSFIQARNILSSASLTPVKSVSTKKNKVGYSYENFNLAYYWNVYQYNPQDIYLFAGPSLIGKLGMRVNNGEIGNSALTYDAAGSVAFAAKAMKYFSVFPTKENEENDFKVECSLSLPLISSVFTPPYIGLPENLFQENGILLDVNSNYTGYLSNYFNIELGVSLTYYLKNRNAIEFSYFRDYTSTKPAVNPAKTMNQFFSIKLMYNLN